MRGGYLSVIFLQQVAFGTVENADGSGGEWCGVSAAADALAGGFYADEFDFFVGIKGIEHAEGVAAAADAGDDAFGQFSRFL